MLVDTHTHLYLDQFDEDRDEMLKRAEAAGVGRFYLPNIDSSSIDAMLRMEKDYPEKCFPMMGLHPCSVQENYQEELALVKEWLSKRVFCAVGEIGLDYYWDKTFAEEQKEAFLLQVEWAIELDIPIVIHSRESIDDIIFLLKNLKTTRAKGVFHCFTGTPAQAAEIMDLGFFMGIGGVITFKNSGLDATLKEVPIDFLVLETDSPYLAPVPHRGKRNESAYIRQVAMRLAEVKDMPVSEIESITTKNAGRLFNNF